MWELETLQCIRTLTEHTSVVMSVLCWDQFLLSCSLDQTIKAGISVCIFTNNIRRRAVNSPLYLILQVWALTESGTLEVTYTHQEEHVCISASF